MIQSIIVSFQTLTALPLPFQIDTKWYRGSLLSFPLVGLSLGLFLYAFQAFFLAPLLPNNDIQAVVLLFVQTWLTGFLHMDGLGDVADAFGGGKNREHILLLLKDPRKGSFGVTAICFDLLLKYVCWKLLLEHSMFMYIIVGFTISRYIQALVIMHIQNVRGSKGLLYVFQKPSLCIRLGIYSIGSGIFISHSLLFSVGDTVVSFLVTLCMVTLFCIYSIRKIGGITGDCVGTSNEIAEFGYCIAIIALKVL